MGYMPQGTHPGPSNASPWWLDVVDVHEVSIYPKSPRRCCLVGSVNFSITFLTHLVKCGLFYIPGYTQNPLPIHPIGYLPKDFLVT